MEVKEISVSCVHNKIINMSWLEQEGIFYTRHQNTTRSEREDHKPMAYVNDALVKIYLLEKESGNSGRNRTVEMICSHATMTLKHRQSNNKESMYTSSLQLQLR